MAWAASNWSQSNWYASSWFNTGTRAYREYPVVRHFSGVHLVWHGARYHAWDRTISRTVSFVSRAGEVEYGALNFVSSQDEDD